MIFRKAGPALLWSLIVTVLTLLPGRDLPDVHIVNFDKMAHFAVFGLLEWLYLNWICLGRSISKPGLVTLGCIAYGGLIEILQGAFYIDRYADFWDFTFNSMGCIAGWIFFSVYVKKSTNL
ncbi:MAG: VanZ family protein [Bacteroidia bacterium]|jgi:succinate-acetate transporter protein